MVKERLLVEIGPLVKRLRVEVRKLLLVAFLLLLKGRRLVVFVEGRTPEECVIHCHLPLPLPLLLLPLLKLLPLPLSLLPLP